MLSGLPSSERKITNRFLRLPETSYNVGMSFNTAYALAWALLVVCVGLYWITRGVTTIRANRYTKNLCANLGTMWDQGYKRRTITWDGSGIVTDDKDSITFPPIDWNKIVIDGVALPGADRIRWFNATGEPYGEDHEPHGWE